MGIINPSQNIVEERAPAREGRVFVSYAQNLEDVMLNRLFPGNRGFYIDVGAQDPVRDSVTYAFYQRGWRGLNIEPTDEYFKKLTKHRPLDINLQLAASDHSGHVVFHELAGTGLSTTNPDYAQQAVKSGFRDTVHRVPCETLDTICAMHNVTNVDFLKIDVEGAEEAVLRGFSLSKIRPAVLVIEATEPCSTKPSYGAWEPLVRAKSYDPVYDDGLNRFYLARERADLRPHFAYPPNVFDRYQRHMNFRQTAAALAAHAIADSGPIGATARAAHNIKRGLAGLLHITR